MQKYLEAGKIVAAHGIRGELKINPTCDSAEFLRDIGRFYIDGKLVLPQSIRVHKKALLVKLEGIDTIDAAQPLIGKTVYFDRDDAPLPSGRYFICDLIGLKVFDITENRVIGVISEVLQPPANDVYVVREGSEEHLIPAAGDFIVGVDLEKGVITVKTIEGML